MEEASEIAKLRLFLALVASARSVDELEPLPNIDFNILVGNSLIGLMQVDDKDFENRTSSLFRKSYREILSEKNRLIDNYRHTASYASDLRTRRDNIDKIKAEARDTLNDILLAEFENLGIKYEEATWDTAKNKEGKPKKRKLAIKDIEALTPFHWGYEFDEIINKRGGFDAIITNPPWEIFKPQAKEFFLEHSDLVTKKKMTIKEFEKEQTKLMKQEDIRAAWIEYESRFSYVSQYFRSSDQYKNQIAVINGKKAGTDINLYKLFVERCFNLLRRGGECGIVIPSGIYTDLGTKQLRELLFSEAMITGLFCLENRKEVFENVHRSFKIVVLSFEKGKSTINFPAAFMRLDVSELQRFPQEGAIDISVELIRRVSPDSLSIMEFSNLIDIQIVEKMLKFPALGEKFKDRWNLILTSEFHMTNDSALFKTELAKGRLTLYEGKMIHQFESNFSEPRYWANEKEGRNAVLGRSDTDSGQMLDYQKFRLGIRAIARNTDMRTLIVGPIPKNVFCGNSILVSDRDNSLSDDEVVFAQALLNSFTVDFYIRQMVSANINMFYIYQIPVPRLNKKDKAFKPIVERAARLICTTPEFDDLAKEVGLGSHKKGVTNEVERARLRAELDGLVAHLYGLTEEEFAYILTTFPLVSDAVKVAALNAYRDVEQGLIK